MLNKLALLYLLLAASGCTPYTAATRTFPGESPPSGPPAAHPVQVRDLPPGISIHRLNNGLEVLLIENPALPMIGVNTLVRVGSAYENYATSGMSHLLEHLLFNGTTTRTQKQLYEAVDLIGGYNNASTSTYYTNYMLVTPTRNIVRGLEIQADMLFHSTLPVEKFDKEKGIVLEEIAQSLASPAGQLERERQAVLFAGHALSLPTLGTYATLEGLQRDDVYRFYREAYVPNNMLLSAIGNFQTDSLLARIEHIYGSVPPGPVSRPETPGWAAGYQSPPEQPGCAGREFHRFYGGDKTVLDLYCPLPAGPDPEFYTLLETALEGPVDTLEQRIKVTFPEALEALSLGMVTSPVKSWLRLSAVLKSARDLSAVNAALAAALPRFQPRLEAGRLEAVIVKARTDFLKNIEKPHMFGIYNSETLAGCGSAAVLAAYGPEGYRRAAEQVRRFRVPPATLALVHHPHTETSPSSQAVPGQAGEFTDPRSGVTVIARQNPHSGLLAIHFLVMHKARLESAFGRDAAKLLHDCLEQRLTSPANLERSRRFGFDYTVNDNPLIPMDNIYLHPDFGYIRAEGLADDIPGAIAFLTSVMQDFIPSQAEFERARIRIKPPAHFMGGDRARRLFEDTWQAAVYASPDYPPGSDSLSYADLAEFSRQYLRFPNMIVSVVSPAPADTIHQLFRRAGPTREHPQPAEPAYERPFQAPSEPQTITLAGGGEQAYLFWGFLRPVDSTDAPVLQVLSLLLADRISFDIREQQGLAYRLNAGIDVNREQALCYIRLGTRPQNVDTLLDQFPRFFDPQQLAGVTEAELQKTVNMYLGRMVFRRLSSINQAYYLGHSRYFHGDHNHDAAFHAALKQVTLEEVRAAARKYLRITRPVTVVVR